MAAENRRQHYVPHFYLESFRDKSGYLWVYEVGRPARRSLPREVAHQRDYYAFTTDGQRYEEVDKCLQASETVAGIVLPKIARAEEISPKEWSDLCTFMGLLFARVPATRKYSDRTYGAAATRKFLNAIDDLEEFALLFERFKHRIANATTAEDFRRKLREGYQLEQDSQYHNLLTMLDVAQDATEALSRLKWEIVTADGDDQFVTADSPVVTVTPDGQGWATYGEWFDVPNIRVLFPLSPTTSLVLRERSVRRCHSISSKQVRCVNSAIMGLADRFMFAAEQSDRLTRVFDKRGCRTELADAGFLKMRSEWLI